MRLLWNARSERNRLMIAKARHRKYSSDSPHFINLGRIRDIQFTERDTESNLLPTPDFDLSSLPR